MHEEERHVGECLATLAGLADEIVVLDDGSRDATVAIATAAGARVMHRPFDDFGRQKQAALDLTEGDWVLSIDADERVTPTLAAEIRALLASGADAADGYWVRREMLYLGAPLRFGGAQSDWVLRLARRGQVHVAPLAVHERLEVSGRTGRLRGRLLHHKYRTLSEHLATIDRYTTVIAAERRARGRVFHAWHVLRVGWELFARLVLRLGLLDGRAGVVHATMAAFYAFLKYAKLWPDEPSVGQGRG